MKDLSIKKLYYSISEVSKITEVEQYVLRYWETEFEQLKPQKNRAGNRIYTNKDIKLILQIKNLLRDQKYTIEGARNILDNGNITEDQLSFISELGTQNNHNDSHINVEVKKGRPSIKKDLEEIKNFLQILLAKL